MELRRHLRIMTMLMKMKVIRTMAFRFSFFGVTIVDGSLFLVQLLMFSAIYSQVESIGGWEKSQILFFIGTFSLINALNMTLYFFGVTTIPNKIRSGQLDLYVTKPVNTLFYVSFEDVNLGSIPLVLASIGILVYATPGMNIEITAVKIGGYILLVTLMTILYYDMEVILRTIRFFIISATSIDRIEGELLELCFKIPGVLFKRGFKVLFYLVLPYGIMATLPTQFFKGTLGLPGFLYAIGITFGFTAFTLWFWKLGLRNYKSASS
jgi:ABC-2 type transport system permease protein